MYYGAIKKNDIADGPGVRVSLFVSGCRHHCKGCFQPQTWDFCFGQPYTLETQKEILDAMAPFYVKGLTVLGGEPFEPENQKDVAELISAVKKLYPEKDIWCYSGYLYDVDMVKGGKVYTEYTDEILSQTDVLVDGEFVLELKNLMLKFRGSSNQRLIDVKKSTPENVVLWDD
ncbi:MAG: anaerobic ribonucleoside-triphosphate reductase activating protein [Lachnospiraceae bacterium]|nr:anaerobic ribonucleoside-triphosphate reductase activating protein [Lachnospiraceae bacterium]